MKRKTNKTKENKQITGPKDRKNIKTRNNTDIVERWKARAVIDFSLETILSAKARRKILGIKRGD